MNESQLLEGFDMKKTLLAAALAVSCASAQAHSNQCEYSLDYNVAVENGVVTYTSKSNKVVEFNQGELKVDGKNVSLSDSQKKDAMAFQAKTQETIPKIADIAIEGAELGLKAASLVVTSLFGEDQDVHKDLIQPIEKISTRLKENIKRDSINTLAIEKSFDVEFDQEVEALVSKAMSKYSGRLIGQVLSSIFSGDQEDVKDFEFRMENLEHDIETYVSANADKLELKAEKLCDDFKLLAELDERLESVSSYPKNGLIEVGSSNGLKASSFTFNAD